MTNIITREPGWGPIAKSEIPKLYDGAMRRASKLAVSSALESAEKIKYPTLAERFGAYVRDLFAVYSALLEAMKTGHHWVALSVHSTLHSSADFDDAVLIGQSPAEDQVQVRGRTFDPLVFDFAWRDNTMDANWTAWNWEIDILPNDPDDRHYFFDRSQDKLIETRLEPGPTIYVYNLNPKWPSPLSFFEVR